MFEGLSVRPANVLNNMGITSVDEICHLTPRQLLRQPNFGRKSLNELREWLFTHYGKELADGGVDAVLPRVQTKSKPLPEHLVEEAEAVEKSIDTAKQALQKAYDERRALARRALLECYPVYQMSEIAREIGCSAKVVREEMNGMVSDWEAGRLEWFVFECMNQRTRKEEEREAQAIMQKSIVVRRWKKDPRIELSDAERSALNDYIKARQARTPWEIANGIDPPGFS